MAAGREACDSRGASDFRTIGAFMMLTTVVAAHVIARAAALGGAPLWKDTVVDERPETVRGSDGPLI